MDNNTTHTPDKAESEIRALREELETQKALWRELVESVPAGVMVLDSKGVILQLNRNATGMFDIEARNCVGRHYSEVVPRDVGEAFDKALAGISRNGYVINMPLRHWVDKAIEINLGLNATLFDADGKPKVVIVCHDRTAVTELERLRTLDIQKTESVSRAAHELKNPLSAIKAYCEVLAEMYDPDDTETGFVKGVNEETDHTLRLLAELLNVSTIESGQLKPSLDEIDLADVVRNTLYSIDMTNTKHRLVLRSEQDMQPIVGDALMLREVITNLVSNAIRYSPDGGDIIVQIRREGRGVRFDVIDHGLGISKEHLANIFEKFYRVYNPEHNDIPGSGLGLAIVKGMVEAHRGSITAESAPGEGSKFSVLLPVSRAFDEFAREQSAMEHQPFA